MIKVKETKKFRFKRWSYRIGQKLLMEMVHHTKKITQEAKIFCSFFFFFLTFCLYNSGSKETFELGILYVKFGAQKLIKSEKTKHEYLLMTALTTNK